MEVAVIIHSGLIAKLQFGKFFPPSYEVEEIINQQKGVDFPKGSAMYTYVSDAYDKITVPFKWTFTSVKFFADKETAKQDLNLSAKAIKDISEAIAANEIEGTVTANEYYG